MKLSATKLRRLALTAVGALGLASAMPAQAATSVFDFGGNNLLNTAANPDIYAMTVGSLTVTIRAYGNIYNTVNYGSQTNVTWTSNGLGANGNDSGQLNHEGGTWGGLINDPGEGLLLTFSQAVTLDQMRLGGFDDFDDADFAWGNPLASGSLLSDIIGINGSGVWNPLFNYTGTHFFLAAKDDGFLDGSEGFRLDGLTVSYTAAPGGGGNVPAAVPEPATWAMMLLGFGLVGAAMRRRQQRQTVRYSFA